jgi:hypothetical protein
MAERLKRSARLGGYGLEWPPKSRERAVDRPEVPPHELENIESAPGSERVPEPSSAAAGAIGAATPGPAAPRFVNVRMVLNGVAAS